MLYSLILTELSGLVDYVVLDYLLMHIGLVDVSGIGGSVHALGYF